MKTTIAFLMLSICAFAAMGTIPSSITSNPTKVLKTAPGNYGVGLGFGLNRGMTDYHRPSNPTGEYSYTNFSIIPHAIIPIGERFSLIPGLGIYRGHSTDKYNGNNNTDEYSESGFTPMLDFIRWCSDPCDKFQTYTGVHAQFYSGSAKNEDSYKAGNNTLVNKYDSKFTSTGISVRAGAVYNITPRVQLFGSIDIIGYSTSKNINDTKNKDVYSKYSGVNVLNSAAAGVRFPF